jgi:hypothetical protein
LPGGSPDEGRSVLVLGTPLGESNSAPLVEASPGALTGLVTSDLRPTREVAAIAGPPSPTIDWQK